MTITAPITARAALDVERSQLGVAEQPPGSNMQPYGAWYGMNGVAWCDIFQTWALVHAGWLDVPHFAATTAHAAWFQRNGAWLAPSKKPPAGALGFFDWGHGIAHIGMVEGVLPDGRISTIEGNTDSAGGGSGGRVMRQYRAANIAGYGVITYQPATPPEEDDMPRQSFLARSDDPKDARIAIFEGDFSGGWVFASNDDRDWLTTVNALQPDPAKRILNDVQIHTVKASVFASVLAKSTG